MNQDCSIAFRLSYLLGMKESKIKEYYPQEYKDSNDLKLFENYRDAKKLRLLCRLRNSVIKDFSKYSRKLFKSLEGFQGVTNTDIKYLSNHEISINKLFYDLEFIDYFNMLSSIIDTLVYKVLLDLEVPYIEDVLIYFSYPTMNEKELENFVNSYTSLDTSSGIYIYDAKKIKTTLKYVFNNDMNCIMSAYSLLGKSYFGNISAPSFAFRTQVGADLDETVGVKVQEIIEEYKGLKDKRAEELRLQQQRIAEEKALAEKEALEKAEIEKAEKEKAEVEVKEEVENTTVDVERDILEIKKEDSIMPLNSNIEVVDKSYSVLVIDCMNTDFFNFVCFMKKTNKYSKIVLINDFSKNYVWNLVSKLFSVDIERISIDEYNENSISVSLTQKICEKVYLCGLRNIGILSNSTCFYKLFDLFNGVSFSVYTTSEVDKPFEYFTNRGIEFENINNLVDKFTVDWVYKDVLSYTILYSILNNPLTMYNKVSLENEIDEKLSSLIPRDNIKAVLEEILKNVSINIEDNNVDISSNSYVVKLSN